MGEAYNVGCETPEITISELANRMANWGRKLFGYAGQVRWETSADVEYLTDNPQRRCPDISKARNELGFLPTITLDEGLRRTLLWYSDNRGGQEA